MPTRAGSIVDHRDPQPNAPLPHPGRWLRFMRPAEVTDRAPLVVLIHEGPELAPGVDDLECAIAWLDPSMHPYDDVEQVIADALASIAWLIDCSELGHDPERVVVIGRGAGAHLAAMVAVRDPRPVGFVLVSGVYDLTDDGRPELRHVSPLLLISGSDADCVAAWASADTCAVRRQGQAWAATWSIIEWNRPATAVEVSGRPPADLVAELFDASSPLGAAVLRTINRTRTT